MPLFFFEGVDSVGKTTLLDEVERRLILAKSDFVRMSFPGNETGTLGKLVYEIHHRHKEMGIASIDPTSIQVLHIAAHIDAIQRRIRPELSAGKLVLLDRFWWSTLVYGIVGGSNVEAIKDAVELEKKVWGDLLPTAGFLITRDDPFHLRPDESRDTWDRLRSEYLRLAEDQRAFHPVQVLNNPGSIDVSVDQVMPYLPVA